MVTEDVAGSAMISGISWCTEAMEPSRTFCMQDALLEHDAHSSTRLTTLQLIEDKEGDATSSIT